MVLDTRKIYIDAVIVGKRKAITYVACYKSDKIMSRSKYTNECSVPHQRGRKQILKGKRLSNKRVRKLSIETDEVQLKRTQKSVKLDKDPPNNFICL